MEAALEKITAVPQPPAVYDRPVERDDPLLLCLVIMSRIYGVPKSPTALSAGLPIPPSGITPELFVHAADRIGLSASMARRKFDAISALSLPCVLMLKDGQACVFLRRVDGKLAEIATPENLDGTNHVSLRDLADRFTGTMIAVRPKIRMDVRSSDLAKPPPRSWFWGSVFSFTPIYLEVIVAALLLNTFAIASPIFTMIVYDRVVPNQAFETLWVLAIGVGMAFGFDFLLRTLRGYFLDRAGKDLDKKISARIFEQILSIKMAAGPASAGAFASNVREFETLRDFFTSASLAAVVDLPFLLFFLLVIWFIGGPVVLVPAIIIPMVHRGQHLRADADAARGRAQLPRGRPEARDPGRNDQRPRHDQGGVGRRPPPARLERLCRGVGRILDGLALLVDDLRQFHVAGLQHGDGRGGLLGRLPHGRRRDDDRRDGRRLHAEQPRHGAAGPDLRPDRPLPPVLDLAQGAQSPHGAADRAPASARCSCGARTSKGRSSSATSSSSIRASRAWRSTASPSRSSRASASASSAASAPARRRSNAWSWASTSRTMARS